MSPITLTKIFIVLCLRAHPDVCKPPVALLQERPPTLMECMIGSQQAGAAWINLHPMLRREWFVARVQCSSSGMRDGSVG